MDVIIADDSDKDYKMDHWIIDHQYPTRINNITLINHYGDKPIGSSAGRNDLLKKAKQLGYTYAIISDDDFELNDKQTLPQMASIYSQENVDIVSTLRNDIYYNRNNDKLFYAGLERSKGSFVQVDDSITVIANITKPSFEQTELSQLSKKFSCQYSELIQQFFFAEIDSLEDLWDPILSSQDHYHMLVTAKKKGLKLLACQGLEILHDKGKCQRTEADFPIPKGLKLRPESDMEEDYELARHENADSRIKYFMKKFKIKEFVTESGSTWIVRGNELEKYPSDHSGQTVHRVTENQQFFDDWLVYINSNRAGWEYLKYPGPAYSDLLRVANYGQCTTMVRTDPWIKGAQAFKFWRNEEIYTGDELDAGKFYF